MTFCAVFGSILAQEAAPGGGDLIRMLFPIFAFIAIAYFIVWRPESRKRKERQARVGGIKKGERVVTNGGIIGKVWKVEEREIVLVVDKDVKMRFIKGAIYEVLPEDEDGPSPETIQELERTR